jgi:carbon monoxide dehydrogenase subunit G
MKISIDITTQLPVEAAWNTLTNWQAHGQWIPLTKMIVLNKGEQPGLGDKFIGRTGIGALVFDDVMTVTRFEAPGTRGFCEVTKSGRLVKGNASFAVAATDAGTVVTWVEDIPLPAWIDTLIGWALKALGAAVFRSALRKALHG